MIGDNIMNDKPIAEFYFFPMDGFAFDAIFNALLSPGPHETKKVVKLREIVKSDLWPVYKASFRRANSGRSLWQVYRIFKGDIPRQH